MVSCPLNGVPVEALWDTGAQVSIVSGAWARPQWRTDVFFDSERKVREDSRTTVVSPLQSS